MSLYCVIPARGNSKGIKNKNLLKINNNTLLSQSIKTAKKCKSISMIAISSESKKILNEAKKHNNVILVKRPNEFSNDEVMPDIPVAHALEYLIKITNKIPQYSCFIQCTTPFLNFKHIENGYKFLLENNLDCLFSGYESSVKLWLLKKNRPTPINHSIKVRLGRQFTKKIEIIENGAFYIFNTKKFLKSKHRFFGKVGTFLMKKEDSIDIDDDYDYKICNLYSKKT